MNFQQLNDHWRHYKDSVNQSERLCLIKAFRDQLLSDPRFNNLVSKDPSSALQEYYPDLTYNDIVPFVSHRTRDQCIGELNPSNEALILQQSLNLDSIQRHLIKKLAPRHNGWNQWRNQQIQRFSQEDKSLRASQITHIPFAIELTQGCSGGCAFCGLSAPALTTDNKKSFFDKSEFTSLLKILHQNSGKLGKYGILYWATDPLDQPKYEEYAELFASEFGLWPSTTTALAETQIDRIKSMISGPLLNRPWGLRLSMRSPSAFKQLCKHLSLQERALVCFLPQYNLELVSYAIAGRRYENNKQNLQSEDGGTIACMSGLLISIPRQTVELVTPCLADPKNINGYRKISHYTTSKKTSNLTDKIEQIFQNLPCPPINLDTRLEVSIDHTQYHLYPFDPYPSLLQRLEHRPASLREIIFELKYQARHELYAYCLYLLQVGALRVS